MRASALYAHPPRRRGEVWQGAREFVSHAKFEGEFQSRGPIGLSVEVKRASHPATMALHDSGRRDQVRAILVLRNGDEPLGLPPLCPLRSRTPKEYLPFYDGVRSKSHSLTSSEGRPSSHRRVQPFLPNEYTRLSKQQRIKRDRTESDNGNTVVAARRGVRLGRSEKHILVVGHVHDQGILVRLGYTTTIPNERK